MHVVRGLRQALVLVVLSTAVALAASGLWLAWQGGAFRTAFSIALMVIAGLIGLTGGTALSRDISNEARAFLGQGPENEEPYSGDSLTGLGILLFVSLPLFLTGSLLYGFD